MPRFQRIVPVLVMLAAACRAAPGLEAAPGDPEAMRAPQLRTEGAPGDQEREPEDHEAVVMDIQETPSVGLADLGPAPELTNEVWLNTPEPLRLAELRGQVVLLEMWTFGCINCQRVVPYLKDWHARYADQGLVVIGNHYPEFDHERKLENLRAAVERLGISYPVAQDNQRTTWSAYRTRFWPTLYLIDKRGHLRYRHIGEGRYAEIEAAIQALLAES